MSKEAAQGQNSEFFPYVASFLAGLVVCLALSIAAGGREAVDTAAYAPLGIPLMAVAILALSYLFPQQSWRWTLSMAGGQMSAMLLTGNTWEGARNLRRSAPEYRQALRARWQGLRAAAARGERDVVVDPLEARPGSYITYFEVREDPEYWENWSVAHYFGLRTVVLRSTADPDQERGGP